MTDEHDEFRKGLTITLDTVAWISRVAERRRLHEWVDQYLQEIYDELGTDEGEWYPATIVEVDLLKSFKRAIGEVENEPTVTPTV
jgi:hypothetical protein